MPRMPATSNPSHRKGWDVSPVFGTDLGVGVGVGVDVDVGVGVAVAVASRIFREELTSPSVKENFTVYSPTVSVFRYALFSVSTKLPLAVV